jgi:putative membrane protein (TIGR04086 family)
VNFKKTGITSPSASYSDCRGGVFLQKKEQEQKKQTIVKDFMKILFLMYAVTMILLLLLAFALFKMELTETFSKVWLIAVYIISGFLGGFLIGKRAGAKKFLWGFLMGAVYFLILFGVSVILYKGFPNDLLRLCTTMILCVASGTVGGMVS